ncbi:hypothetical protein ACIRST_40545 [Kitasatospora sp. NPDC101447]|uniref:hypothetical protein n=1 Tax=Kitasatospora sp. NPDC101447 TaxID=3364102 RepID=UPI0038164864
MTGLRTVQVDIRSHQYWIQDETPDIDPSMYRNFNGLVSTRGGSHAIIMTGTAHGTITVGFQSFEAEPALDLDPWDDVVDVSMRFRSPRGGLMQPDGTHDALYHLDRISAGGPGDYRVRIHARGRDRAAALPEFTEPIVEEHLVQSWPAPTADEIRHKLTDTTGQNIRAR